MGWIELTATIFGVLCVWLIIRQSIWCWPAGLVQVTLFVYIFYEARLYSDMLLHIIYIFLQLYGWYHWQYGSRVHTSLPVTTLTRTLLLTWVGTGIVGTFALGFTMQTFTDAALPYADAFTTVMSLIAQWLLARKNLENWGFWIAVDVVAIRVYLARDLYLTTGLYTLFLVMAIAGFIAWRRDWRATAAADLPAVATS
ncbi:nicotinamide mononucleotide transporter [bacterium]|nr:nicotinamide mononucleotide transporter [bacterium]